MANPIISWYAKKLTDTKYSLNQRSDCRGYPALE